MLLILWQVKFPVSILLNSAVPRVRELRSLFAVVTSTSETRQNQPLFVVDGIIYDNSTTVTGNTGTDGLSRSNTTYSDRIMDINPEDIQSLSVLKGAAAAA